MSGNATVLRAELPKARPASVAPSSFLPNDPGSPFLE